MFLNGRGKEKEGGLHWWYGLQHSVSETVFTARHSLSALADTMFLLIHFYQCCSQCTRFDMAPANSFNWTCADYAAIKRCCCIDCAFLLCQLWEAKWSKGCAVPCYLLQSPLSLRGFFPVVSVGRKLGVTFLVRSLHSIQPSSKNKGTWLPLWTY